LAEDEKVVDLAEVDEIVNSTFEKILNELNEICNSETKLLDEIKYSTNADGGAKEVKPKSPKGGKDKKKPKSPKGGKGFFIYLKNLLNYCDFLSNIRKIGLKQY